eukprot:SAG31_NODE_33879_length_339_cov_0.662500_1_plen_94_part_10
MPVELLPSPVDAGNIIMLADNCCAISEWELDLLGCEPTDARLVNGTPCPAVFAFGHILYEMALGGLRLSSNVLLAHKLPAGVPVQLVTLLDAIF